MDQGYVGRLDDGIDHVGCDTVARMAVRNRSLWFWFSVVVAVLTSQH